MFCVFFDLVVVIVDVVFKVFRWPSTQQLINTTDIKSVNILFYYTYIHYMFRSKRSSSGGTQKYIYSSILNRLSKMDQFFTIVRF
jgi:hypothetical protein